MDIGKGIRMASEEKIRSRILEIASRPRNVTLADIDWVMSQLAHYEEIVVNENEHSKSWSLAEATFSLCTHHPGNKQLKFPYVRAFLKAMSTIGWYE
jgi:hypothetical protein